MHLLVSQSVCDEFGPLPVIVLFLLDFTVGGEK